MDEYTVKEMSSYKMLLQQIKPSDVVIDIGGNIGAFARKAWEAGGIVFSYEPEPENYDLLILNVETDDRGIRPFNYAVVGDDRKEIELYLSKTKNKGSHSTTSYRGRKAINVPAINVNLLKAHNPKYIKIDCEGGEYDIMDEILGWQSLKGIAIEIHCFKKEWRDRKAPELLNKLRDKFPVHLKAGKITPKGWHTMFIGSKIQTVE